MLSIERKTITRMLTYNESWLLGHFRVKPERFSTKFRVFPITFHVALCTSSICLQNNAISQC